MNMESRMGLPYFLHLHLFSWFLSAHVFCFLAIAQRSTYIVHLDKSLMPNVFADHHHWHSSTIDSIKAAVPSSVDRFHSAPKLVYSYDNVFHGFSAVLSQDELEALKKSPGFISAYKDRTVEPHTTYTSDYLKLNPSSGLWPASGLGQDVIIAVLDEGIWPESASFQDGGMPEIPKRWKGICKPGTQFNTSMCNRKLIGANYFNKGILANDPTVKISMNSARDTGGHGTHCASIAAGNFAKGASHFGYAAGTAKGVAPRARLAVYKFDFEEGTFTSDLIAAMDQAVADGVDMISISYGYDRIPLYEDAISIASFGAMMKGVLVSASAGNSGPNVGTLANGSPWILCVASGYTDRRFSGTLTLGNGLKIRGWSLFPARALVRDSPVIYNKTLAACDSDELLSQVPNPGNTIIICDENEFDFSGQESNVIRAGLRAAIYISEVPETFRSSSFEYPGVVIDKKEGKKVIDYVKGSVAPTATITFQETYVDKKRRSPVVAGDSSRGPSKSYSRIAKPDIMAPGVLILAAFPPNLLSEIMLSSIDLSSDYELKSGTSMAAPHAAGIAAMLKGAHPEWSPSAIRSAMMTTANHLDSTQKPIKEEDNTVATPLDMGAGHIDPNRALDPGLVYDATPQDYINLICSMNFTKEQFKTFARSSADYQNCTNPSADLNYPSFIALYPFNFDGSANIFTWLEQKFKRTITNVGKGGTTYKVKIETPKNSTVSVSPQTLVFKKKNEKQSYTVTIRYIGDADQSKHAGSITWIEENGNHSVRSPLVVAPTTPLWGSDE